MHFYKVTRIRSKSKCEVGEPEPKKLFWIHNTASSPGDHRYSACNLAGQHPKDSTNKRTVSDLSLEKHQSDHLKGDLWMTPPQGPNF